MRKRKYMVASITVEASLAVPVFFIAVFVFLYLFECLLFRNEIQDRLAEAAENYAFYHIQTPYIRTTDGQLRQIGWQLQEGTGYCDTEIRCDIPGLPSWLLQMRMYQRIQVHDYSGSSMASAEAGDGSYVYVAENGTVYHRDIGCTYLRLGIQEVAGNAVEGMRNQSGGKYKACESCIESQEAAAFAAVYLTPYGARYHQTRDCPGLRRTVRRVVRDAVGNLPPCSKCG